MSIKHVQMACGSGYHNRGKFILLLLPDCSQISIAVISLLLDCCQISSWLRLVFTMLATRLAMPVLKQIGMLDRLCRGAQDRAAASSKPLGSDYVFGPAALSNRSSTQSILQPIHTCCGCMAACVAGGEMIELLIAEPEMLCMVP